MTKLQFILALHDKLSHLPKADLEERLNFYSEMIEDRMEDGLSEEEAVSEVGSVDDIAAQITADISPLKETGKIKRKLKVWEIMLLILGSPVWISLLIAAAAVIFSLYTALWSVIISLWAVFGSLIGSGLGMIVGGIGYAAYGNGLTCLAMIGAGLICGGLSIFSFFGCRAATKGLLLLTKKIFLWIKGFFIKKEEV